MVGRSLVQERVTDVLRLVLVAQTMNLVMEAVFAVTERVEFVALTLEEAVLLRIGTTHVHGHGSPRPYGACPSVKGCSTSSGRSQRSNSPG